LPGTHRRLPLIPARYIGTVELIGTVLMVLGGFLVTGAIINWLAW
jgi:hypothetical protein